MKATFVPEWLSSSISSVVLKVAAAATVTVILRMVEMMESDQGMGEAEGRGEGEELAGLGEEVRTIYIPKTNKQQVEELVL